MFTKPLLVIQFRTDEGKHLEQISLKEKLAFGKSESPELCFFDAFDPANDMFFSSPTAWLSQFEGVILGGSAEFYFGGNTSPQYDRQYQSMLNRLKPFMDFLLEQDFPTLGICFGHQFLAYALGEKVEADPGQSEMGSLSVQIQKEEREDPLFVGIPEKWKAFFSHRDSVMKLPHGAALLGSGERSHIGAFRFKQHIYGVQFHPELDRDDLPLRLALHPEYAGSDVNAFLASIETMPFSKKILQNFATLCAQVKRAYSDVSILEEVQG